MKYTQRIGTGIIGEKAEQLIAKEELALLAGFSLPHRIAVGQDVFESFWSQAADTQTANSAASSDTHSAQVKSLYSHLSCKDPFLVIRSSAPGDATGIGIYDSVIIPNSPDAFEKGINKVLQSYWSKEADVFREQTGLQPGAGILIEPLIADTFQNYVAPTISGHGFSSRFNRPGYLAASMGLGCAVDGENYIALDETILKKSAESLLYATQSKLDRALSQGDVDRVKDNVFHIWRLGHPGNYLSGKFVNSADATISKKHLEIPKHYSKKVDDIKIGSVFHKLKELERFTLLPQYAEFAITLSGEERHHLIQIGDVKHTQIKADEGTLDDILFIAHKDMGQGQIQSTSLVMCWNPSDIPSLQDYNSHNKNYVLVFPSRLTSKAGYLTKPILSFADISNANVMLEIMDGAHCNSSVGHFGGAIEQSGKWFGRVSKEEHEKPAWDTIDKIAAHNNCTDLIVLPKMILTSAVRDKLICGTLKPSKFSV